MDNVFQMLAQQEIDRPQRRLRDLQAQVQELQLKKMQEDQAYEQGARNAMRTPSLASLGPMANEYQPSQISSLDQALQPPQAQAAPSIVDQFKRQYDYHVQNGRPDLAQGVMDHQIELSMKAAKVADHIYKTGGKEGLSAWLQANPTFAPLLGDPSKMHLTKDGVLFPATDDKGQPVPGMYWHRDENDRPVFKEIKPQTVSEGAAVPDGKGGWIVPAPKANQEDLLDKRFANQQKLQAEQIAAQDRRTAVQIAAADRRSAQKENGPGKVLPAGQLESIADMKRVKDVLAEANNETKGVSTGPVAGRLQALGSKVGMADDSFVNLQQKLQTAQNIMLKLRSGAAVTESEYARFLKEYPTPNDTPEVFKRKMQNTLNYANTLMDDKMQIYEEGGYRVPQSAKSGNKPQGKPVPKPAAKAKRDPLGIL